MRRRFRLRWLIGFAGALCGLLIAGELYLRCFPPKDFQVYLGDASPLTGPFTFDPAFRVRYRSWDRFAEEYQSTLAPYLPLESNLRNTWAFFGNSFVQAPGMLADTVRRERPQQPVFNLGRNEILIVRLEQIRLLLEQGLKPERIFVVLLPLDFWSLHLHSLEQTLVNAAGAITHSVRIPNGPLGPLIEHSRLALTAWIRTKLHHAHPGFKPSSLPDGLHPSVLKDVRHLFENLHAITTQQGVPVTIVLIPNFEQIARGARFQLQDQLIQLSHEIGLDVCDPRDVFLNDPNKSTLFIPDKHFSERGNHLLLEVILDHLARTAGGTP